MRDIDGGKSVMKNLHLVAVDIGAENGKVIRAEYNGNTLACRDVYRFIHNPVLLGDTIYWDILRLVDELYHGISLCTQNAQTTIECVGINTWGADFGLIDKSGNLLLNPLCYRDGLKKGIEKYGFEIMSRQKLNRLNSSKTYAHCTLFQLHYVYRFRKVISELVQSYLPIANLLNYFFTDIKSIEFSMLSGSQFFDVKSKALRTDILKTFQISPSIVPQIGKAGTMVGDIRDDIIDITGLNKGVKVALVCGHDTASAVTGIPLEQGVQNSCFVICGTWSVVGTETSSPILNSDQEDSGFTNWCGYREKNLYVKIFSSFYFIQECRKVWEIETGKSLTYEKLYDGIEKYGGALVDLGSSTLLRNDLIMEQRIIEYFKRTGQKFQYSQKNLIGAILQSIVLETGLTIDELEKGSQKKFNSIYVVGGGSRVHFFCQDIADCTGKTILSGYPEAAVFGNLIVQLIALGELDDIEEGRKLIKDSKGHKIYNPNTEYSEDWEALSRRYIRLKKRGSI
jgi:sugar (pentulose or hexulose) kinase